MSGSRLYCGGFAVPITPARDELVQASLGSRYRESSFFLQEKKEGKTPPLRLALLKSVLRVGLCIPVQPRRTEEVNGGPFKWQWSIVQICGPWGGKLHNGVLVLQRFKRSRPSFSYHR
ncbi:MAG: hypothetical protein K0S09_3141 [Sphingobacteriaceae bacterium]|jgi:hypothetical protein|nr:hypothetical protein [Sphingobacteriaceae bacterium]